MKAVKKHTGALKNASRLCHRLPGCQREKESWERASPPTPRDQRGQRLPQATQQGQGRAGTGNQVQRLSQRPFPPDYSMEEGDAGDFHLLGVLCLNIFQPLVAAVAASVLLTSTSHPPAQGLEHIDGDFSAHVTLLPPPHG